MTDFSLAMCKWETFYLLAGTAAATLMGLALWPFSINVEAFRREAYADLQHGCGSYLNCFFYVLFISIMFLIPNVSPFGLGVPLLLLGILGVANAINPTASCAATAESTTVSRDRPQVHGSLRCAWQHWRSSLSS